VHFFFQLDKLFFAGLPLHQSHVTFTTVFWTFFRLLSLVEECVYHFILCLFFSIVLLIVASRDAMYIFVDLPTTSADLGCHWTKQTQLSEMAASLRHSCVFTRRTFNPTLEKPIGNLATGRACSNAANLCRTTNTWTISLEIAAPDSNKVSPSDSHEP
jgi:hypothetical protein